MTSEEKSAKLVQKEIVYNITYLMQELIGQEKYFDDLGGLLGEEGEDGNMPEVLEYWLVTPWLAEKLKARGELVENFQDLDIWGRQTSGQSITLDTVIEDIAAELFS
jgi:hypothetical protein